MSNPAVAPLDLALPTRRAPNSCNVYTPVGLAAAVVAAVGPDNDVDWLEPSVGTGAFVVALSNAGVRPERIFAVDIDEKVARLGDKANVFSGVDFIQWSKNTKQRFDRVVANPPFISIARLPEPLRTEALSVLLPNASRNIPLGANYWCAFLVRALALLRPGACIAFILPAAWEYADYAAELRWQIPSKFQTFELHRSVSPLFSGVQEGSVVLLGKGFDLPHRQTSYFTYNDPETLTQSLSGSADRSGHLIRTEFVAPVHRQGQALLSEVMAVSIGAVTGHAQYFLLNEATRQTLGLPTSALVPVLSHAKDLIRSSVDKRTWLNLRQLNRRVWLFRPPDSVVTNPRVRHYLELALANGGCDRTRLKVAKREEWFRVPLPRRPDGFASGMSRMGPWLCLNNCPGLTATNTLYTIKFRHRLGRREQAAWALSLLSSEVRETLRAAGRRYADGLLKYEPNDLMDISLPIPPAVPGATWIYARAVRALLAGTPEAASRLADQALGLV